MYAIAMSGTIGADPAAPTDSAALMQSIDLAFQATYDGAFSVGIPIAGTDLAPFEPDLGAITAVRAIALRAVDGQSLVLKVTSGKGTDQAIPVSAVFVLQTQNDGDELTAIKVVGTGRIEILVAGDLA